VIDINEPEIRLDQLPLRLLVALVLAPRELALLRPREQAPVADLANVEPEWILRDSVGPLAGRDLDRIEQRLCLARVTNPVDGECRHDEYMHDHLPHRSLPPTQR
jgi:hypothetical protein